MRVHLLQPIRQSRLKATSLTSTNKQRDRVKVSGSINNLLNLITISTTSQYKYNKFIRVEFEYGLSNYACSVSHTDNVHNAALVERRTRAVNDASDFFCTCKFCHISDRHVFRPVWLSIVRYCSDG